MEKQTAFTYAPSRGKGILFLSAACAVLGFLESSLLKWFDISHIDLRFFLVLIAMIIFAVPLAFLLYRLYSLIFSYYRLERDGLHIQWGLRSEVIPLNAIEWIRSPREMTEDVPWSVLPMPGAYLGTVPVGEQMTFEFLASDMGKMLFLGTSRYIYAISPRSPEKFMTGFERILQMGTLTNVPWTTARPAGWLLDAWNNRYGRLFTLLSLGFLVILYIWSGLHFQDGAAIGRVFAAEVRPGQEFREAVPRSLPVMRMQILPVAGTVIWIFGTILGLWFYQQKAYRRAAELMWGAASAAVLQCLIAAFLVYAEMVWGVVAAVYVQSLLQALITF